MRYWARESVIVAGINSNVASRGLGVPMSMSGGGSSVCTGSAVGMTLLVYSIRIRRCHRRTGITSLVRWSNKVGVVRRLLRDNGPTGSASGCELGIPIVTGIPLLLSESEKSSLLLARAVRVTVSWRRAISLLLLVVPDKHHLKNGREEEEANHNERNDEHRPVESAGAAKVWPVRPRVLIAEAKSIIDIGDIGSVEEASTKRSSGVAGTASPALPGEDSDCDESSDQEQIEENAEDTEGGDTTDKAGQKDGEKRVDERDSCDDLDGDDSTRSWKTVIAARGDEVGKDAEYQKSSEELDETEEGLKSLQGGAAFGRHGCER